MAILFIGTAIPNSRLAAVTIVDAENEITIAVCNVHVEKSADYRKTDWRRWIDEWKDEWIDG